ncbi:hypothetical protein SeseC_01672 [Streptococcus equi subsp. zooepidemicus ATCC 35246]|nr:hypothetical protein SeseC_01672 [Streptococcus equi subsp. zooepidemicus ATCC 35246]
MDYNFAKRLQLMSRLHLVELTVLALFDQGQIASFFRAWCQELLRH